MQEARQTSYAEEFPIIYVDILHNETHYAKWITAAHFPL